MSRTSWEWSRDRRRGLGFIRGREKLFVQKNAIRTQQAGKSRRKRPNGKLVGGTGTNGKGIPRDFKTDTVSRTHHKPKERRSREAMALKGRGERNGGRQNERIYAAGAKTLKTGLPFMNMNGREKKDRNTTEGKGDVLGSEPYQGG